MSEGKTFTFDEVKKHTTKKDLWMAIHDKVYSISDFVDEHPGGEEVLMDVAGQDATEAFEDVGHSGEAREILGGFLVGNLKQSPPNKEPPPPPGPPGPNPPSPDVGVTLYAVFVAAAIVAFGAYKFYA